ncbi:MAG: hypothetical protein ACJ79H_21730 [Myxococcales bacterium]
MSWNVYIDGHVEEKNPKKRKEAEEAIAAAVQKFVTKLATEGVNVTTAHGSFATLGNVDVATGEPMPPEEPPAAEEQPEPAPEA